MNIFEKMWYRLYQKVMYVASAALPWREPKVLKFDNGVEGLPKFIKEQGYNNVLLVCGPTVRKHGLIDGLVKAMDEADLKYAIFSDVVPNPTIENVEEGLKLYNENHCEAIIAFGGGSNMDCAKCIGIRVVKPKKPISKFKGVLKVRKKIPTLYAVPTTAGSGSETTLAAVISNSKTHEKYAINDINLIPPYAVLDPKLTVGLPANITATTGMDALTHAVEAFIGHSNTKGTMTAAVKAVKLIFANLENAVKDGSDIKARENMQMGSYYAGVAFTRAYVGYVHAIAHTLGGFYNIPHGLANAVILPYVLEAYGKSASLKLLELAQYVGVADMSKSKEENGQIFIDKIKEMEKNMGVPNKIKGIKKEDIPKMVDRAYKEAHPLYPVPRLMTKKELTEIYYQIMEEEDEA